MLFMFLETMTLNAVGVYYWLVHKTLRLTTRKNHRKRWERFT